MKPRADASKAVGVEAAFGLTRGTFLLDVAFVASPGITALVGPSGAGKTTIINCIAGLERPAHGWIRVDGVPLLDVGRQLDIPARRRPLALVRPGGLLPRRRTVRAVLGGPTAVADRMGVAPLLGMRTADLSPAEQRRIAVACAVAARHRVVLLDGLLDGTEPDERPQLEAAVTRLRGGGMTVIHACHDAREAARIADAVVLIQAGRVVAAGPPSVLTQSVDLHGWFADAGAVVETRVCGKDLVNGLIELRIGRQVVAVSAFPATVGQPVVVRFDPEHVVFAAAPAFPRRALTGNVRAHIPLSRDSVDIGVACGPVLLWSRVDAARAGKPELAPGSRVHVLVERAEILAPSSPAPAWRPRQGSNLQPSA